MHRIAWTTGSDAGSCLANEGLFRLPLGVAEAMSAYGVALVPQHAVLLAAEGPRPLTAGVPACSGNAALTWEPSVGPSRIQTEECTHREEARDAPPPTLLTTWEGETRSVDSTPLLIGRHPACGLRIHDERVSQFHCILVRSGDAVRIIDLASTNGSYVDGVRVQQATITHDAALRLGRTRLILSSSETRAELLDLPSPAMRTVLEQIRRVAPTRIPVLIHGESGVGKDLVARLVHQHSGRTGPLVAINAASLSPALAASELFGYVRGAFTSAERDHAGAFLRAHEGTLFLDELAELSLSVQAELLRAVELGRVRRLGDADEVPVDVRLVAATHRDLAACVRVGSFREDLYHRLCVVPIDVPPLRERPEDLDAIADGFLRAQEPQFRLTPAARVKLHRHPWTGNVRELLNALRRACTFAQGEAIETRDIVFGPALANEAGLGDVIRARVLEAYADTCSVAATAKLLGIRRPLVRRVLKAAQHTQRNGGSSPKS